MSAATSRCPGVSLPRGEQPVPRPARPAPVPGPAGAVPAAGARPAARRRGPAAQGDAADGGDGRASWHEAREVFAACLGGASGREASRPRCRRSGIMVETPAAAVADRPDPGRLLLDRQQRSDPVRHGGLARRRRPGGRAERSAASGGAAADRPGRAPWRRDRRCRSACAATWRPIRRASPPCSASGLRRLSVAPAALGRVKLAVAGFGGDAG